MPAEERAALHEATMGQAENVQWHSERIGRLTASKFRRIVRCRKPDGIVRDIMYPRQVSTEPMWYGRFHEEDAVKAYSVVMASRDHGISLGHTGLHIHREHPFIAASPDRLVFEGSDIGLLEVKCSHAFKGKTIDEAAAAPKFCCRVVDEGVELKKNHEYYYQVQGLMGVTGLPWCDFVVWTNAESVAASTHVERIFFDKAMWEGEILPGLLHFFKNAVIAEKLTGRVKRQVPLYGEHKYVPAKWRR